MISLIFCRIEFYATAKTQQQQKEEKKKTVTNNKRAYTLALSKLLSKGKVTGKNKNQQSHRADN